jgi:F0F1-type ATP synthase delta subunit
VTKHGTNVLNCLFLTEGNKKLQKHNKKKQFVMDNDIIKIMIENRRLRAYSLIVQLYFDKIETYKTSVFKIWLAKELNISPELIHDSSINAAMARYSKKQLKRPNQLTMKKEKNEVKEVGDFNTEIPADFPGFK